MKRESTGSLFNEPDEPPPTPPMPRSLSECVRAASKSSSASLN